MSVAATALLLLVTAVAGIDGYRAGRRRAIGLASALGLACLGLAGAGLLLRQAEPTLPLALAGALLLALLWLRARLLTRRRVEQPDPPAWRLAGMAASVLAALLLCQALGLLATVAGRGLEAPPVAPAADPAPARAAADPWAGLRAFGSELGELSGSLLGRVPVLGTRSAEMVALLRILNADQDQLARIADRHRLRTLAERPAVAAALQDEDLLAAIEALAGGELTAIERIMASPSLAALASDQELRRLVSELSLAELAAAAD